MSVLFIDESKHAVFCATSPVSLSILLCPFAENLVSIIPPHLLCPLYEVVHIPVEEMVRWTLEPQIIA